MYEAILAALSRLPEPYEPGEPEFWDDPHISAQMLRAHLNPDWEAASRKHEFIDRSAGWIAGLMGGAEGKALLDLGCGPGLYAERFAAMGMRVTGVDISRRSVEYARESAARKALSIEYLRESYLNLSFPARFDAAILIYCDMGVLSPADRLSVLRRARAALKPGGLFVADAWGPAYAEAYRPGTSAEYAEGGFWTAEPHVALERRVWYADTRNTLDRHVVIARDSAKVYNIWNQVYDESSLSQEILAAGFAGVRLYGDAAGAPLDPRGQVLCAVATV